MNTHQIISLFLQGLTLVVFIIGFTLTFYQVRQLKRQHKENHDWNRRLAAQNALLQYDYSEVSRELNRVFQFVDRTDALSSSEINESLLQNKELKTHLHQLLNFYEGLARGINQGVFDESVIKAGRMGAMMRSELSFRNYI